MPKRLPYRIAALMHALAALALLAAQPAPQHPQEMRGLWVVRTALVSPESVDQVVDQAADAGFNALFVQVRGRGDAFYASSLVPRSLLLERQPAGLDPLARLVERARGRGLEVHAWINVLLAAGFQGPLPSGHVVAEHPDWVMVPRAAALAALRPGAPLLALVRGAARGDADVEGYYLSPAAPGVAEHLEAVVGELVRGYAVDGLHLDFIRYPGREFDYSRCALASFGSRSKSRQPLQLALASPEAFAAHRREQLSALASRLAGAARRERPGLRLSAAVVPDEATALNLKYQDWPGWIAQGVIDAVCPMTYSPDDRIYKEQLQRARELAGARSLWAGVGAYRLSLDAVIERIAVARQSGASGVVVFSHESLQGVDLSRLREQAFSDAAQRRARAAGETSPR
jgi:uncharacterized lipoprotein YddW (UPF0748 family)